jgi:hypothetical protein
MIHGRHSVQKWLRLHTPSGENFLKIRGRTGRINPGQKNQ